jgi:Ice-binding-like
VKPTKITVLAAVVFVLFASTAFAKTAAPNVPINLGTATNFGLLAGSGITNASAATRITGDVGSSPTPTVTGLTASQVNGTLYTSANAATAQAQADLIVGYNQAAGATCTTNLTGTDLGGLTLVPGVYCFSSSALLTGTLTLDGQGNASAQWVFQIGSTLTTATNASVLLINSGVNCNVFWQIGSSATIQTGNTFVGNIMALTSITLDGGVLNGRALARNGAVTISAQETVTAIPCTCNVMVSSSSAGTVTNISFAMPYVPGQSTETVIATGLTSAEGLTCGADRRLYLSQSGVFGGPMRIVRLDQNGQHKATIVDFSKVAGLAGSGGPSGLAFDPSHSVTGLFFGTTLSQGLSNTGMWNEASLGPIQSVLPFPPQGNANGAGATAFLTAGPFKGNLLAVDEANKKVIRVPPPFSAAQAGIDFITANLTSPVGLAINGAGNVFVSNTDGSIQQFGPDGTSLGLYATTGLHNMNITFDPTGHTLIVATQEGPVLEILANGAQESLGTVVGGDGIAICKH